MKLWLIDQKKHFFLGFFSYYVSLNGLGGLLGCSTYLGTLFIIFSVSSFTISESYSWVLSLALIKQTWITY